MSGRFLGLENRTSAHGPDPLPWLRVFPPAVTFADVEADIWFLRHRFAGRPIRSPFEQERT